MPNPNYYPDPNKNPYRVTRKPESRPTTPASTPTISRTSIDFNTQRVCPSCGKIIKASHNFCKYCGVDLSAIDPIGKADRTLKELATTALTDPNADVRKDAVGTLGDFGEHEVLGVLAYVLLNDPDEMVRKEAADELGDLHHPISLDVLAKALKDRSPIVRKEAIESLKKIKTKNKPKELTKKEKDIEKRSEIKEEEVEVGEKVEEKVEKEEHHESIEAETEETSELDEEPLKQIEPQDDDYYKI